VQDTHIEPTVIAGHSLFKGELHLSGPTVVAGRIEGAIFAEDALEVAAEGVVEGDIHGVVVDIQGTVKGNVIATQACRLGPTARVAGELRAANLSIAEGACFVGQVYVGGGSPVPEQPPEEASAAPVRAHVSAPVINRIEAMAQEADAVAEMAAAVAEPAVRVNTQAVQQTIQRSPKIIKAR
jgi:cytoskeletal protein CcmA (bactofilin family)